MQMLSAFAGIDALTFAADGCAQVLRSRSPRTPLWL